MEASVANLFASMESNFKVVIGKLGGSRAPNENTSYTVPLTIELDSGVHISGKTFTKKIGIVI